MKHQFEFRVYPHEIPHHIDLMLSEKERDILAKLLTYSGISVKDIGDTFQYLYRQGLELLYREIMENNKSC